MSTLDERYNMEETVAEGRFCRISRAVDQMTGRRVAVKQALSDIGRRMLRAEVELTARLPPTVRFVPIPLADVDYGWVVLPWLEGGTFRRVLGNARPADARALRVIFEVIETVAAVHAAGLIHGDLKPDNILLDGDGRPFLTDFGLAKEIQSARLSSSLQQSMQTDQSLAGGTLTYMAPELVKGGEPSLQGDVFALGVILHEALFGLKPGKACPPDRLARSVDPACTEILSRALAFRPGDRFASAGELLRALEPIRRSLVGGRAVRMLLSATRRTSRMLGALCVALRYTAVVGLLGGYASLLVTGVVVSPYWLILFLPILIVHIIVGWRGPESADEARARRGTDVLGGFPRLHQRILRRRPSGDVGFEPGIM